MSDSYPDTTSIPTLKNLHGIPVGNCTMKTKVQHYFIYIKFEDEQCQFYVSTTSDASVISSGKQGWCCRTMGGSSEDQHLISMTSWVDIFHLLIYDDHWYHIPPPLTNQNHWLWHTGLFDHPQVWYCIYKVCWLNGLIILSWFIVYIYV